MKLATTTTVSSPHRSGSRAQPVVVIMDSGSTASLVVLSGPSPRIGSKFRHLGVTWEITHLRNHTKAFVARPAMTA